MKLIIYTALFFFLFSYSCNQHDKHDEKDELVELPSNSIFNLNSKWQNQDGKEIYLRNLQGKVLVVVMIYTSCKTACPILISKMKNIASKLNKDDINNVSLVLVSIDPETDTPEHLKEFSINNAMDKNPWIFLRSNENATQEFANILAMKYKKISPLDFSHSNIITVFNSKGQLVTQEEGDINVDNIVEKVSNTILKDF
ncbi:MAG: SCO family protein [Bacteroidetes bacterium]|nr:SCO family protein [Bacteroidota bacterium]